MTRVQRFSLGLAVVVGTVGLTLLASTAFAAPVHPRVLPITVPEVSVAPEVAGLDATSVLDPVEYQSVSDFTRRVTPYIKLDAAGVPQVTGATAEALGVDARFLADFQLALAYAYQAVEDGHIVLNADLTVERTDAVPPVVDGAAPIAPAPGTDGASVLPGADGAIVLPGAPGAGNLGDVPQWGTWHYPQGAMFYNSYTDYWNYYYNNYYVLCSAMAARLGYPWLSPNLVYFYTYNNSYFYNYCYSNMGTYFYMPYSSMCQQYNPCWCCGMSYRPVYFWVRSYSYNYGCGCYQQNWNWQGYWARY
jgi:hypothetical protein